VSADEGRQTFTTQDGREIPRPRKKRNARVPDRYQKLIDGSLDVTDLDDEELFRGLLRNADGHIRGTPPNAIPWVMHKAAMDHVAQRLERTISGSMPDIIDSLIRLATGDFDNDTGVAMDVQAKAAMYLADRILGRPTERKEMSVQVHAKWEQAFEGGSLVVDLEDPDIIDAELVNGDDPQVIDAPALPQGDLLVERSPAGREDGAESNPPGETQPPPRSRRQTGVKLR
jgi:hypothetical protein